MKRAATKGSVPLMRRILRWATGACLVLLAMAYITPHVPVTHWGWLALLTLAYPFLLLAQIGLALAWFLLGRWEAWLPIVMLAAGLPVHARYIKILAWPARPACETPLVCASYNLRGLSMVQAPKGAGIPAKVDTLYAAFKRVETLPDILCLQEVVKGDACARRFDLEHMYHAPRSTLWLFSRYPITRKGSIDGAEKSPCALWADIKTPQGMLRVYNIHLVSNRVTNTTQELIDDFDDPGGNRWENVKFIVSRYRRTTIERAREAGLLRVHMAECPHPVIIAGDANDTPLSNTIHVLSAGLTDSFRERGLGLSTTYSSIMPLLRIDYLLGTPEIRFTDHDTYDMPHSDHSPVIAGFCVKPREGS